MTKIERYKNPPLVEAVFEIFYKSNNWSPVIPGLFYNEVKEKFPIISANKSGFGIIFDPQGLQLGGGNSEITQYKNELGNDLAQLTNGFLTVNKLPPYESWESYKNNISYSVDALLRVLPDLEITRLGLKFINKVDIVENHSYQNIKKYFEVYPILPGNFKNSLTSCQLNIESQIIPDTEIIALSLLTIKKEKNYNAPVMLQLYYTRIKDLRDLHFGKWLQKSYEALNETFDKCLTKICKDGFN